MRREELAVEEEGTSRKFMMLQGGRWSFKERRPLSLYSSVLEINNLDTLSLS
jgi:hypothetical protein